MKTEDDQPTPGRGETPNMFGHFFPGYARRKPEEQLEAERKERARRGGKGRRNWWKEV